MSNVEGFVVVQVVAVRWTKASRGDDGATRRAAVASAFALPSFDAGGEGVVHTVECSERSDFAPVEKVEALAPLPCRIRDLTLTRRGDDVGIAVPIRDTSARWSTTRTKDISLGVGEYARMTFNRRYAHPDTWYEKVTVSIASVADAQWATDLFTARSPDYDDDQQIKLF